MRRSSNDRRIVASAVAGIVGPTAFVGAWVTGGLRTPGYSFVGAAISRLAAVHATTRPLMTGGFVTFGVALPIFGQALRREFGPRVAVAATISGLATLGVAAFPLDHSDAVDRAHAAVAFVAYVATSAMPALAERSLRASGMNVAANGSASIAAASALSLVASTLGPAHGLFQRTGLTVVDVWMVVVALTLLRGKSTEQ